MRKNIIEFPFRLQEDQPMTQEQFDALSDEDAFKLCNKAVLDGECDTQTQANPQFNIERQAYQFEFKNTGGMYSMCRLCDKRDCKSCLVPYNEQRVEDMLDRLNLVRNDSLFQGKYYVGKELVCNVTWHTSIVGNLFDFLATATAGSRLPSAGSE